MNLCAKVRRRTKGKAKEGSQLHLINSYNKSIDGVNLMDRLLESYGPTLRGKYGTGPCLQTFSTLQPLQHGKYIADLASKSYLTWSFGDRRLFACLQQRRNPEIDQTEKLNFHRT